MTARQFWGSTALSTFGALIVIGAIALMAPRTPKPFDPTPAPIPAPLPPLPAPAPDAPAALAVQKAKLKLSDGRTATFVFSASSGSLTCAAAIGLDEVLGYLLSPVTDPPPPTPTPTPGPAPKPPSPKPPTPVPTPPARSNLRVLFTYDPLAWSDVPPAEQAIFASPELRSYLDKHCPLESGCSSGQCPLTASKTPSYRFLPFNSDVSRLTPVWQKMLAAIAGKPVPWMIAINEAGQTVIDQAWPGTVEETLKLLKRFGGQ